MTLEQYFDKIIIINMDRRKDRWQECLDELDGFGIDRKHVERFEAYDHPTNGHVGCTRSHRTLIRAIASSTWKRVLVLEDDFAFITLPRLQAGGWFPNGPVIQTFCRVLDGRGTINQRFDFLSQFFPEKWDILYLGACYGEPPISRLNSYVIRCGLMLTTGSYGITNEFAKVWDAKVTEEMGSEDLSRNPGPIDNLLCNLVKERLYYVTQPRMIYQRLSRSDLDLMTNSRLGSCTDTYHENLV